MMDHLIHSLLHHLDPDPNREGLLDTPARVRKAWEFHTSGYTEDLGDLFTTFEDGASNYNEMVLVKDIPLYSHCEHHLEPFFGVAHVAYIPDGRIVGLSKINRLVGSLSKRLQVQERLTRQIVDVFNHHAEPIGVAAVLQCRHLCMESRGVCQKGHSTVTSALVGAFTRTEVRQELFSLIGDLNKPV